MRATLWVLGCLAFAGCLPSDAAPPPEEPRACSAGGTACPPLAGSAVSCEGGRCVARSGGSELADCTGDGRYDADLRHDARHCGGCGLACPGSSVCVNGACGCAPGDVRCDGACVSTATHRQHCGACGRVCAEAARCVAGACVACPSGERPCGDRCVRVDVDAMNYGACGRRCEGRPCVRGACLQCQETQDLCRAVCVDLQSSNRHCGRCDHPCGAGFLCRAGVCEPVPDPRPMCPAGTLWCLGLCRDITTDRAHCGGCDVACPSTATCRGGSCVERCDAGISLFHSDTHCGACGVVCAAGTVCVEGRCAATSPRLLAPISGAFVTSARPWFRWELPGGADGARVEVCSTRACAAIEAAWEVAGDRLRAPVGLARGVHFWRAYARRGGRYDAAPSLVWEFAVPAPATSPYVIGRGGVPVLADVNGDGVVDRFEFAPRMSAPTGAIDLRYGRRPDGTTAIGDQRLLPPPLSGPPEPTRSTTLSAGWFAPDLNGDGLGEFIAQVDQWEFSISGFSWRWFARLYGGLSSGVFVDGVAFTDGGRPRQEVRGFELASLGDRDGDGYGDLGLWDREVFNTSYIEVLCGREGRRAVVSWPPASVPRALAVGDFNGDGRSDVVHWADTGRGRLSLGAAALTARPSEVELFECPRVSTALDVRVNATVADDNDDGFDDLTLMTSGGIRPSMSRLTGGPDGLSSARCTPLP